MEAMNAWEAAKQAFAIEADAVTAALKAIPEDTFKKAVDVLA